MDINFDSLIKTHPKLDPSEINENVARFCKSNRIFGGSFAILSKRFKRPFLLFSKDLKDAYNLDPEIDFYQYLNTPYDSLFKGATNNKYFIDFLFYIFRMEGIPEYVKRLNEDNKNPFELPFQTKLRQENKILHCSTGEILFFLLSWRIVIKKVLKDVSEERVLDYFNINRENLPNENKFHTISTIGIVKNDPKLKIEEAINRNLNAIDHLKDEKYLKDLGLIESSIFQQDLRDYLNYIGFESEISNEETFFIELNQFFDIDLNGPDSVFLLLKKIHLNSRFPILPYYYIYKFDNQNRRKDHFVTPVWWTYSEATKYESQKDEDEIQEVLHSLYTLNPLPDKKEWYTTDGSSASDLSKSFKDYLFSFNIFFSNFVNPIIDSEYYSKQRDLDINDLKKDALKASLAAVMSRNMSHNIGSHVLNKMSDSKTVKGFFQLAHSGSFTTKGFTPDEVYKLSQYFPSELKKANQGDNSKSPQELSRVFNDYLKKRMDFVADVATTDRATITNTKYLFSDVFKNFERNLLLLHNISGKEDQFKFEFKFQVSNGKDIFEQGHDKFYDPVVAMPNDVLGDQAFYIILENIIRNTAKHSGVKRGKRVNFTIKVDDSPSDFYKITIYDDIEFDTRQNLVKLIYDRNKSISDAVLDKTSNEIRKNGWGTIELKLAACYLSRVSTSKIDSDYYAPIGLKKYNELFEKHKQQEELEIHSDTQKIILEEWDSFMRGKESSDGESPFNLVRTIKDGRKRIPLLQAVDGDFKADKKGFGYTFLIKKPKDVLLVIDDSDVIWKYLSEKNDFNETNLKTLRKLGLEVVTSLKEGSIYSHNYVIIKTDFDVEKINLTNIPQEIYFFNELNKLIYWDFKSNKNTEYHDSLDLEKILQEIISDKLLYPLSYYLNYLVFASQPKLILPSYSYSNSSIASENAGSFAMTSDYIPYLSNNISPKKGLIEHHKVSYDTFKNSPYVELFGSSSQIAFLFDSHLKRCRENVINVNVSRNELSYFFQRGISTGVIIIDERVQTILNDIGYKTEAYISDNGDNEPGRNYSNQELFEKMNIKVPPLPVLEVDNKNFNLNETEIYARRLSIVKFILRHIEDTEYLIMHFGILESLRKDNGFGIKISDMILFLEKIQKRKSRFKLIITSGRGHTPDIKELNKYFLPYSVLSNLLLEPSNRSKSHLVKLLKSLRLLKKLRK